MPELPEVQNFVYAIEKNYVGLSVEKITFHRANLRYPFEQKQLEAIFARGTKLIACFREGKQLVLQTQKGSVNVSLGMSGCFKPAILEKPEKHEHVTLNFEDNKILGYVDARRFGFWKVRPHETQVQFCDPLNEVDLKNLFLSQKISSLNRSVKDMLMDQQLIGGLGNIYVCEALFRAGISPLLPCHAVVAQEWRKLAKCIPALLQQAIEQGGSSISTYRTLNGEKGNFQNLHLVYERHGQNCSHKKCTGKIVRVVQGGRGSWYCPACQRG
ncbi:MAG: bifunctional DNA-formamidopyrimidine glycosylase/DNA-(apurinic or apyrimidinic site) lyase [Bdellovibrionota bacterium]